MKCYSKEYGVVPPDGYVVGERLPDERRDRSCLGELFIQLDAPSDDHASPTFPVGTVLRCDLNDSSTCPWFTEHGCARDSEYWCNLAPLIKIPEALPEPRVGQVGKTRNGRGVRIICTDRKSKGLAVVVLIEGGCLGIEDVVDLDSNLSFRGLVDKHDLDIVELDGKPWPRVLPVDKEQMRLNAGLLRGGVTA